MKKYFLLLILHFTFYIINCFSQQYGWVNIGSNVPGDALYHDLSDVYLVSDTEFWITSS